MLYSIEREKYVKELPHRNDFKVWRSRLSDADYERVVEAISAAIGDDEVSTAGWIPGRDWTGTPYEPLYYACGRDTEQAGRRHGEYAVLQGEGPQALPGGLRHPYAGGQRGLHEPLAVYQ